MDKKMLVYFWIHKFDFINYFFYFSTKNTTKGLAEGNEVYELSKGISYTIYTVLEINEYN